MAVFCKYRRSDGVFLGGQRNSPEHDDGTEIVIEIDDWPDRTFRWDGDVSIRPPTAQETTDLEEAEKEAEATRKLNADALARTILNVNFDQEERLRVLETAPAITKLQYTTTLKALYKSFL